MLEILPKWLQPCFTTSGRLGRRHFWLAYAVTLVAPTVIAIFVVPLYLAMEAKGVSQPIIYTVLSPIVLPAIVVVNIAAFCVAVRRLHDRDKSGAWLAIYFGPLLVGFATGLGSGDAPVDGMFSFVKFGLGLCFLAECGGLSGTPSVNRFGPPPGRSLSDIMSEVSMPVAAPEPPPQAPAPDVRRVNPQAQRPAGFGKRMRA